MRSWSLEEKLQMKKIAIAVGLAVGLGTGLILFLFDPARAPFYPVCQFHQLTGLCCPGCGSLRAMHELLHGHLMTALHLNLLLVVSLPLFAWVMLRLARQQFRGGPAVVIRLQWVWLYLTAWITFGVVRNLPGSVFAFLTP
jgi:hypothetical protein